MTDITDKDRHLAREWAASVDPEMDRLSDSARAVARIILATVDAPAPTLAEELREVADNYGMSSRAADRLHDIADRVERDLAEASAEVERLTAERDAMSAINDHYDHYAVQKGAESNAETPNPADVNPGEAWRVQVGDAIGTGLCDADPVGRHWAIYLDGGSQVGVYRADQITLVSRLVPAPRVITNPDELDKVKRRTVIRDAAGVVCERDAMGDYWTTFTSLANQKPHIDFPATVLWEPGA